MENQALDIIPKQESDNPTLRSWTVLKYKYRTKLGEIRFSSQHHQFMYDSLGWFLIDIDQLQELAHFIFMQNTEWKGFIEHARSSSNSCAT